MSEAKHSPLLPCPFCGSSRIEDIEHLDWVCCQDCGASLEDVEPSARALWNTRSATSLHHGCNTRDARIEALEAQLDTMKLAMTAPTKDEIELHQQLAEVKSEAAAAHAEVVQTQDELGALLHHAEARLAAVREALEKAEYASRKDSLTESERLSCVRTVVCAAISKLALGKATQ